VTAERKAILRIEGWNILEKLQLTNMVKALYQHLNHDNEFFSFDKCEPDNVGLCFNLHRSGTKALILHYLEILFAGLDNLITRKDEILSWVIHRKKILVNSCPVAQPVHQLQPESK